MGQARRSCKVGCGVVPGEPCPAEAQASSCLAKRGGGIAGDAARWVFYDEAADLLGMPAEAVRRVALHRGWPRRPAPAGGMLVAVPEAVPGDLQDGAGSDEVDLGQNGARTLLDYLEAHCERLTEELAEARTEMRGVRYEAESLRIEAGRAQVLAALVEAERARVAEIRAERDRLAADLAEARRGWVTLLLRAFRECRPPGWRAF